MKRAVDYAHLIGKAIRMERDGFDDNGDVEPGKHGMQDLVVGVWDVTTSDGERGVYILGEDGMGCFVGHVEADEWHFAVFDTDERIKSAGKRNLVPQTFGMSQWANVP